jgi:hypothetical protein
MKRPLLIGALFLMLVLSPVMASASLIYHYQNNFFETDEIVFEITDVTSGAEISIANYMPTSYPVSFDWSTEGTPPQSLTYTYDGGSIEANTGNFIFYLWDGGPLEWFVNMDNFDFTLTWTEFLGGVEQGSGSVAYLDGVPTAVPTPLPASVWLLLSGLGLFVGIRRHRAD